MSISPKASESPTYPRVDELEWITITTDGGRAACGQTRRFFALSEKVADVLRLFSEAANREALDVDDWTLVVVLYDGGVTGHGAFEPFRVATHEIADLLQAAGEYRAV